MKSKKGITLIALVITIVVLIILAGITINIIFDNNGIINKAKESGELTKKEAAKEKILLLLGEYEINQTTGNQELSTFLAEKVEAGEITKITEETLDNIVVELDGYEITISKSTQQITDIVNTNIRIGISYSEGTVGETATAVVTVTNNKETVDNSSLQYAWSNSGTTEPTSWTSFSSGATLTHAVAQGETWFLWIKANYEGGNIGTESKRVSTQFTDVDRTPPVGTVAYNPSTSTTGSVVATITTDEEIQVPSGWTKTSATTYTKTYTRNTSEPIAIIDGLGNAGSMNVNIMNIYVVPTGFTASVVAGETTTDGGLVVRGPDSSEFVWVSVPNPVLDVQGMNDTQINAAITAELAAGRYPMAIRIDATNYKSVLYYFSGTTSVTIGAFLYETTGTGHREPNVLTASGYDNTAANYTNAGITGITNATQFQAQLQNEYNQMVASVVANGGFYIGRYETSLNTGKVQSKPNTAQMTAETASGNKWYGMYQKQKLYPTNNSLAGINSSMIWGCQWDQVLIWMKNVINSNVSKPYILDSTGMGNYSGSRVNTGSNNNYKVKNIYDMAGNLWDWTLQGINTDNRVMKGGGYLFTADAKPAGCRGSYYPTNNAAADGSRLVIY